MGGYNTLVDATRLGKPTVIIPRMGPSGEQRTRAECFQRLGFARSLLPEDATHKH